jgi:hypothetical protein
VFECVFVCVFVCVSMMYPIRAQKTQNNCVYTEHVESNSGDNCVFSQSVRVNRGDYCVLRGWVELNRGDNCHLSGLVEMNRGDHCLITGTVKVNYGDYCMIGVNGKVDVDIGYNTSTTNISELPNKNSLSSVAIPPQNSINQHQMNTHTSPVSSTMECCICLDAPKQYMFEECGHLAVCQNCKNHLGKERNGEISFVCPLCTTKSNKIKKVFY